MACIHAMALMIWQGQGLWYQGELTCNFAQQFVWEKQYVFAIESCLILLF